MKCLADAATKRRERRRVRVRVSRWGDGPAQAGLLRRPAGTGAPGHHLTVGDNVIRVQVTAEDDTTTQTYEVTVTRGANAAEICGRTLNYVWDSFVNACIGGIGVQVALAK